MYAMPTHHRQDSRVPRPPNSTPSGRHEPPAGPVHGRVRALVRGPPAAGRRPGRHRARDLRHGGAFERRARGREARRLVRRPDTLAPLPRTTPRSRRPWTPSSPRSSLPASVLKNPGTTCPGPTDGNAFHNPPYANAAYPPTANQTWLYICYDNTPGIDFAAPPTEPGPAGPQRDRSLHVRAADAAGRRPSSGPSASPPTQHMTVQGTMRRRLARGAARARRR